MAQISERQIVEAASGGGTSALQTRRDPSTKSIDYLKMEEDWDRISDILEGLRAIQRKASSYLPKYDGEDDQEYKRRVVSAPWRPIFSDIVNTISSKPFGKNVLLRNEVDEKISGELEDKDNATSKRRGGFVDDVDGRGNNLTVFSQAAFSKAVAKGGVGILVDYPATEIARTLAEQKNAGDRPYWLAIDLSSIRACRVAFVDGKESVVHVRITECETIYEDFKETQVDRIRILEPDHWELWEHQRVKNSQGVFEKIWVEIENGDIIRAGKTPKVVPLVLYFTGDRDGVYAVKPSLAELSHMQIELYRALSREDEVLTFAGSPMLKAKGMAKGDETISVGPKKVLYAPSTGEPGTAPDWDFIQPDAANIKEVREKVESIIDEMRRLGMQPLTIQTGSPTATGQNIDAARAHSSVKSWALAFNDAIEQAFVFTTEWMGISDTVQTKVSTDFWVQQYAQAPLDALNKARDRGDISRTTYWEGLRRFDVLEEGFDAVSEKKLLEAEPPKEDPTATSKGKLKNTGKKE